MQNVETLETSKTVENLLQNSVVIVNKPPKLSSHEVSVLIKKMFGVNRSGHAGTLDPNVSGVLAVAMGKATKLLRFISAKDKTYVCIIKFKNILKKDEIEKLFAKFVGNITQTPPKESAVRKVARKRQVYSIKFLEQNPINPRLVLFETKVEAGTYIRTLCIDMGKLCGGARMEELRRVQAGKIHESSALTMQELKYIYDTWKNKKDGALIKKFFKPPESYIDYPKVVIKKTALSNIKNGAQIMFPAIFDLEKGVKKDEFVALYSEDRQFFGVGTAQFDYLDYQNSKNPRNSRKGIAVRIERIHFA